MRPIYKYLAQQWEPDVHQTTSSYSWQNLKKRNITYKIRGYFTCQSENCIYCLICNCCNKRYIRESSQNNRLHGHESHIKNYHRHPGNPVVQHFGINLNKPQEYKIQILDQESDKNQKLRLEEAWIFILNTLTPGGLNIRL